MKYMMIQKPVIKVIFATELGSNFSFLSTHTSNLKKTRKQIRKIIMFMLILISITSDLNTLWDLKLVSRPDGNSYSLSIAEL